MRTAIAASAIILMGVVAASAQTGSPAGAAESSAPHTSAPAPSSSNAATAQPNSTSAAANEPLRQQVRDNLTRAGFTDIKIMPTSFLVRAKDQSGNPVMMVMNPDSFSEVTTLPATNGNPPKPQSSNAPTQNH
jgi:hypothetical protein